MRNVTLLFTTSHVIGTTVNGDSRGSQFANRVSPGQVRLFEIYTSAILFKQLTV